MRGACSTLRNSLLALIFPSGGGRSPEARQGTELRPTILTGRPPRTIAARRVGNEAASRWRLGIIDQNHDPKYLNAFNFQPNKASRDAAVAVCPNQGDGASPQREETCRRSPC